jgi:hypothetical protein
MHPLRGVYCSAQALTDAVVRPPFVRPGHLYSQVSGVADVGNREKDYERIRIDMQTLFTDLAIETPLAA